MTYLANLLSSSAVFKKDLDYHLIRASMVLIFLMFGYQKWFNYEAQVKDRTFLRARSAKSERFGHWSGW